DRLSRRSHFRPRSIMGPLRAGPHEALEVSRDELFDVLPTRWPACSRVRPGRTAARARAGRKADWRPSSEVLLGLVALPQLHHLVEHVEDGTPPALVTPPFENRRHFNSADAGGLLKRGVGGFCVLAVAHARDEPEVLGHRA